MTEDFPCVVRMYRAADVDLARPSLTNLVNGNLGVDCWYEGTPYTLGRDNAALITTRTGYELHFRAGASKVDLAFPIACELARWDRVLHGPLDAPVEAIAAALLLPAEAVRRALKEGQTSEEIAWRWHAPPEIAELRVRLVASPGRSGEYPSVRRLAIA